MGDSINVPVQMRTHELNQIHEFVPRVIDKLERIDTDNASDRASELERIYAEYIDGIEATYPEGPSFAAYVSMPADDWRTTIGSLARLYDEETLRVRHFRRQIVKRLRERMEEMED